MGVGGVHGQSEMRRRYKVWYTQVTTDESGDATGLWVSIRLIYAGSEGPGSSLELFRISNNLGFTRIPANPLGPKLV
jgi:hypothetical protein